MKTYQERAATALALNIRHRGNYAALQQALLAELPLITVEELTDLLDPDDVTNHLLYEQSGAKGFALRLAVLHNYRPDLPEGWDKSPIWLEAAKQAALKLDWFPEAAMASTEAARRLASLIHPSED